MDFPTDANVLVGLKRADDAGVYRVNDDLALIQTVDFFTPIVDDPYWFGQIAAANALSDVYAMGGVPKTAMNLVCFPVREMDLSVLREIILGGMQKLKEAQVVLIGGHSVEDKELKYGLSVTGYIHPDRVRTKQGIREGDCLVLTKPLGTGIINTAIKGGLASPEATEEVTSLMATLNRGAAECMEAFPVHGCTDITGFGLLGHLAEMITGTGLGMNLDSSHIPLVSQALDFARMGLVPAGAHRNRQYRADMVTFAPEVSLEMQDVLFDPQTSGGLLIALSPDHAPDLVQRMKDRAVPAAEVIGRVVSDPQEKIFVMAEKGKT